MKATREVIEAMDIYGEKAADINLSQIDLAVSNVTNVFKDFDKDEVRAILVEIITEGKTPAELAEMNIQDITEILEEYTNLEADLRTLTNDRINELWNRQRMIENTAEEAKYKADRVTNELYTKASCSQVNEIDWKVRGFKIENEKLVESLDDAVHQVFIMKIILFLVALMAVVGMFVH